MYPSRKNRFRTLASLLDAQPKGLVNDPEHRLLWDIFMTSEKLQKLRISPRCYRLLNNARIPPENLKNFYRTYRLPEEPFFALFLAVKSRWLLERAQWKEERNTAILSEMKKLPELQRRALRLLAEYEELHNPADLCPLWENQLFPSTKKRTGELIRLDETGWYDLWRSHLHLLADRYPTIPPFETSEGAATECSRLWASLVLRCRPAKEKEAVRNYRRLSKIHHPDNGGDARAFRALKEARDILLE